jgi:hypothetical protein
MCFHPSAFGRVVLEIQWSAISILDELSLGAAEHLTWDVLWIIDRIMLSLLLDGSVH